MQLRKEGNEGNEGDRTGLQRREGNNRTVENPREQGVAEQGADRTNKEEKQEEVHLSPKKGVPGQRVSRSGRVIETPTRYKVD